MDFDGDGRTDIVAGDTEGQIWFFRNQSRKGAWKLAPGIKVKAGGKEIRGSKRIYERFKNANGQYRYRVSKTIVGSHKLAEKYTKIDVADLNGDGLVDLIVGHSKPEFLVYYNHGKKGAPAFDDPVVLKPLKGQLSSRPSPCLVDWNGDGKVDLLSGGTDGMVRFFPNVGTRKEPRFIGGGPLAVGGKPIKQGYRTALLATDWNGDGKLDLLVGNAYAGKDAKTGKRTTRGGLWVYLRK